MSATACVSLGSNLGDRRATLDRALGLLGRASRTRLVAASTYHATRPVGGPPGQGDFLNAAATLETSLGPDELLATLQEIEQSLGRMRAVRWDARTLDLDLLLYDDLVLDTADLVLPHPRMAVRRFVLAPLAEVAPRAIDPLTGGTVAELLANLDRRPGVVALRLPDGWPEAGRFVRELDSTLQAAEHWIIDPHGCESGDDEERPRPTFAAWLEPGGPRGDARRFRAERLGLISPIVRGVPILRLDADDPAAALGEIVAACRASRPPSG